MIKTEDLTNEQLMEASKSLCQEIDKLCHQQPAAVVMLVLATLAAKGILCSSVDRKIALKIHKDLVTGMVDGGLRDKFFRLLARDDVEGHDAPSR